MRSTAYIGMGSNLGDRAATLAAAIAALAAHPHINVLRVAKTIDTTPFDTPPDSPRFLNTATTVATDLEPLALLDVLQTIEADLGRQRSVCNAPRTLDLDLLLYDDRIIDHPRLIVPHPRLHERAFVLVPLAEIAPDVLHPVLKRKIGEMARERSSF